MTPWDYALAMTGAWLGVLDFLLIRCLWLRHVKMTETIERLEAHLGERPTIWIGPKQ